MANKPRVSAASARAHTRKKSSPSMSPFKGICTKYLLVPLAICLAWFYKGLHPPPPKVCGTPFGPPITATRIQLHDGRHLAYKERGVPKEIASYKVIMVHGFGGSRNDFLNVSQSLIEELGAYFVGFDRAGYGQSDPNPNRSVKSEAFDIEELADLLQLGPQFYIVSYSIGGYSAWACLNYIPHRLAGVAMLAPVTNYWWFSIPLFEAAKAYKLQPLQDKWALLIAHYVPSLTYWWNTQNFMPKSSVIEGRIDYLNTLDRKIIAEIATADKKENEATQQSVHESLHRDMMIMFSRWEFDPCDLDDPFPEKSGSVHIWLGDEDYLVPVILQRHIHRCLPWIHYHELSGVGHLISRVNGVPEQILKALLLKNE